MRQHGANTDPNSSRGLSYGQWLGEESCRLPQPFSSSSDSKSVLLDLVHRSDSTHTSQRLNLVEAAIALRALMMVCIVKVCLYFYLTDHLCGPSKSESTIMDLVSGGRTQLWGPKLALAFSFFFPRAFVAHPYSRDMLQLPDRAPLRTLSDALLFKPLYAAASTSIVILLGDISLFPRKHETLLQAFATLSVKFSLFDRSLNCPECT